MDILLSTDIIKNIHKGPEFIIIMQAFKYIQVQVIFCLGPVDTVPRVVERNTRSHASAAVSCKQGTRMTVVLL